jgi:hypothetical protein
MDSSVVGGMELERLSRFPFVCESVIDALSVSLSDAEMEAEA